MQNEAIQTQFHQYTDISNQITLGLQYDVTQDSPRYLYIGFVARCTLSVSVKHTKVYIACSVCKHPWFISKVPLDQKPFGYEDPLVICMNPLILGAESTQGTCRPEKLKLSNG